MTDTAYLVVRAEGEYETSYENLTAYFNREKAEARVKAEEAKVARYNELVVRVAPAVTRVRAEKAMQIPTKPLLRPPVRPAGAKKKQMEPEDEKKYQAEMRVYQKQLQQNDLKWRAEYAKWEQMCVERFAELFDELGLTEEERELFDESPWSVHKKTQISFFIEEIEVDGRD